jgi:integrase
MANIYQRGKTWWGRVQRDGQDIRKSLKTKAESVARKRLKAWLDEIEAVSFGDQPRRTFDDAMLKFIDEHLPTMKPSSAKRYLVSIAALTDFFEGKWLDEISSATLSEFVTWRQRGGRRISDKHLGKRKPKPIKPGTIRRDLACLSSMFTSAGEWEWVASNPVPAFLRARKKRGLVEGKPKRRWLRHHEETAILAECAAQVARIKDRPGANRPSVWKQYYIDLADAIAFSIETGLREDELFSLELDQIKGGRVVLTEDTKNSEAREVPLSPRALEILSRRPVYLRSSYVFNNPETGTRYRNLLRGLKGVAARAGVTPVPVWHDLRRTFGCRMLQDKRLTMQEVSLLLGHGSVAVTERSYAFLDIDKVEATMAEASA